jgi:hypothetical protein
MLACSALAAVNTAAHSAPSVSVGTRKSAVNADFSKPLAVLFSEISAQIIIQHHTVLLSFLQWYFITAKN